MAVGKDFVLVDETLLVQFAHTGLPVYDFDFRSFFPCRSPRALPSNAVTGARVGAFDDYERWHAEQVAAGIRPMHTPEQYLRSSQLPHWYPRIVAMTPRSQWYAAMPGFSEIEQEFEWPIFVKGVRQTSRHRRSLAIVRSREEYLIVVAAYQSDPILRWQPMVVREFIPLRLVEDVDSTRIPSSFEFRSFWWRGQCVGSGRYWWQGQRYDWNASERREALALGEEAAKQVDAPFLVIDLAMTAEGQWIVIECNDGQESGYAGVSPLALWSNILAVEACRKSSASVE